MSNHIPINQSQHVKHVIRKLMSENHQLYRCVEVENGEIDYEYP
ncbi:hypothetical protein KHAB170019_08740 [Acinetobacter baumannii]|nr:hypothetical protein [Acinetobacter baumannii]BCR40051.1 hypothetical protein KHAB170019_08740 [Acinetobacter baumannii]